MLQIPTSNSVQTKACTYKWTTKGSTLDDIALILSQRVAFESLLATTQLMMEHTGNLIMSHN